MSESRQSGKTVSRAAPHTSGIEYEWRTWTSTDGNRSQEAAFIGIEDGHVFVRMRSGATGRLPIAALSPADRAYIHQKSKQVAGLFDDYALSSPSIWESLKQDGWDSTLGKVLFRAIVGYWGVWFGMMLLSASGLPQAIRDTVLETLVIGLLAVLVFIGPVIAVLAGVVIWRGWAALKTRPRLLSTMINLAALAGLAGLAFLAFLTSDAMNLPVGR